MKRELGSLNGIGENINEGSRPKRRKEAGGSSSDVDVTMSDPAEPNVVSSDEQLREQGIKIWQTVKDAVNKEGRILSEPFLQKPPKKKYPDYYVIIQQPIALDDIKKRLETNQYPSLEAVKQDFELLFNNAKQYNLPESQIFLDAKDLLKLVHKTYNKIIPNDEDAENGQPKPPNLTRLIKTRLEKLIGKTDTAGRLLSTEFMQLPSRKVWAIYYKEIKRPQCFDNIFKHIKRKEYQTSAEFSADVELIFSNALQFNQEHTQIWEDAVTLRDYFRQLMSDLPQPHNLPEYTKPSNKIKIKPPQAAQSAKSGSTAPATTKQESGTTSSLLLRVPAHPPKLASPPKASQKSKPTSPPKVVAPPPALPEPKLPVAPVRQPPKQPSQPAAPVAAAPPLRTVTPRVAKAVTPHPPPQPAQQTISFVNATPSHYPRAPYAPPPPVAAAVSAPAPLPAGSAALRPSSALNTAHSTSQSPAPVVLPPRHQLKSINLRIDPRGRKLSLDHRDGVKSWALRLSPGETSVYVTNISFLGDEDDDDQSSEEEEEDMDMDIDVEAGDVSPSKSANGRKKGKGRGRGRPPKAATLAAKAAQAAAAAKATKLSKKKAAVKVGEVQLKLNKFLVKEQADKPGEWSVYLPVGSNIIEVGEVGGMIWKVYAERLSDA